MAPGSCDFSGTARASKSYGSCMYPSSLRFMRHQCFLEHAMVRAPVLKLSEGTPLQKHHELGEMRSRTEQIPNIARESIPSKQVITI
uniref:Uncharacterized protein n=1 Tax=Salix viminalis TaxID=40686 RepID=A0A6N2N994_SALVM